MFTMRSLSTADRASFAVLSRLLSCLVTESLLKAIFIPAHRNSNVKSGPASKICGTCVILSKKASESDVIRPAGTLYHPSDLFLFVALRSPPVLKQEIDTTVQGEIGLLDPSDMLPCVYEVREEHITLLTLLQPEVSADVYLGLLLSSLPTEFRNIAPHTFNCPLDPLHVWSSFCASVKLDNNRRTTIAEELESSVAWQKISYEQLRLRRPNFKSTNIQWERAIVEGHPTHPMHRARRTIPPLPDIAPGQYDYYNPRLRFAWIPRGSLLIQGDFEKLLRPLRESAQQNAGRVIQNFHDYVLFPIHELQIPNITSRFPDAVILPEEYFVATMAQTSIRTLILPSTENLTLKTAIGVEISSAPRIIAPHIPYFSPKFSRDILPRLAIDSNILIMEHEVASAFYKHKDLEVSEHCAGIVRITYNGKERGEKVVCAAALFESAYFDEDDGVPVVVTALGLDDEYKRLSFLKRYVNLIFDAFIPPLLINCVAFEAHGQNTLVRFDQRTGELKGFVYRDFEGLRIHPRILYETTGVKIDTLPGHSILVNDVEDAYRRSYHSMIHCHLQYLIRALGLHYNGKGWSIIKEALSARVPRNTRLWDCWLSPQKRMVMVKSLMKMKMAGIYRNPIQSEVPNLIHFQP